LTGRTERALCVGGVEIVLRAHRGDALDGLLDPWPPYPSRGGPPGVILEYRAIDGFQGEQPADRVYPGYGCRARSPREYAVWRRDSRGTIEIPDDPGQPVVGRFEGNPGRWAIEASLRVVMSLALPRAGGVMIHSAGIASDTRAILFSGPSGAGKSTISQMLQHGTRLERRLGDDLTVARPDGDAGGWRAFATPFAGEIGPAPDGDAPLEAVYFLVKSARHRRERLDPPDALRRLLRNAMAYVQERQAADRALAACAALVGRIPCYILEFARDPGVAAVLGVT
jgi:hypothetical protein